MIGSTPQNFREVLDQVHSPQHNNSSDFWGFLDQCEKDSEKCDKIPMVIFKQDRQPTLAIIPNHVQTNMLQPYIEIQKQEDPFTLRVYRIYKLEELLSDYDSLWFN